MFSWNISGAPCRHSCGYAGALYADIYGKDVSCYDVITNTKEADMKFSTRGRYALRIMIDLAQHDNGACIRLKDISSRQQISVKYLEQIMPLLTRAGYVTSFRGNNGGYRLARTPDAYTVGEILRVTEGELVPITCVENSPDQWPRCGAGAALPAPGAFAPPRRRNAHVPRL